MPPKYNTNKRGYARENFTSSEMEERRQIIVKIVPSMLEKLFMGNGDIRIRTNLPKDVRVISMDWDRNTDTFDVKLESDEFETQYEGSHIPVVWNKIIIENEKDYVDRKVKKLKE